MTVAGPGRPAFGLSGVAARHRAALGELAVSWPDEEMLDLAGPRPIGPVGRRRWAEAVVSCAVRRDLGLSNTSAHSLDNLAHLRAGNSPYLDSRFGPAPPPGRPAEGRAEAVPAHLRSPRRQVSSATLKEAPSPSSPRL